jgi:Icc-related predicted phosphoesterase
MGILSMNIAIFADIHGRLLLAFKLCARWEKETDQKIDLILQAGDLGVFPDKTRLDKATLKYASHDPTELGFMHHFIDDDAKVASILDQTGCDLLFVRGNHEDHQWLDMLEQQTDCPIFPIDAYQRVYCLKSGIPYTFRVGEETISILGIGRIAAPPGEQEVQKPRYIQEYERERLYNLANPLIDVLLTHDARPGFVKLERGVKLKPSTGMEEIGLILDAYKPAYHFFGHYGGPCQLRTDANGVTFSCKLADLHWDRTDPAKTLEAGSMGMLHWKSREEHSFEVVDAPWLREYSAYSWEYL